MGKGDGGGLPGNPYADLVGFGGFGAPRLVEGRNVARPERERVTPEARAYLVKTFGPQFNTTANFPIDKRDGSLYYHWHPGA